MCSRETSLLIGYNRGRRGKRTIVIGLLYLALLCPAPNPQFALLAQSSAPQAKDLYKKGLYKHDPGVNPAEALLTPPPPPPPPFADTTHTFWTRRDGAPGGISSLAQTKDGYLWIGATLGLYRFNGLRFVSYPFGPNSRPLPSLDISSLCPDADGGLWVSFRNTAIVHFKVDGSSVHYGREDGLVANMIEKVIVRPDTSVFAYGGSKIFLLQGERWVDFGKRHGLGRGGVFSVFFDREDNIWVGRDKMLWVLKKSAPNFERTPAAVHYVSSMVQSRTGELWISDAWRSVRPLSDTSPQGVLHIQGKAEMLLDSEDNLWIAQDDQGLSRIRHISNADAPKVAEQTNSEDLSAPRTHALLEDREGNIWVGTDMGLDRYRKTAFTHFRATRLHRYPSLVAADDGSVWINSHGSPLMRVLNGVTSTVGTHVNTGPLAKRRNGEICFIDATSNELQCYGSQGPTYAPLAKHLDRDPPINMIEDVDGSLLASFQSKGLWRYHDNVWDRVSARGLPADDTWGMLSDSEGRLWLGYNDDRVVQRKNGEYATFRVQGETQRETWSNTLTLQEAGGTIWAAGSNGLCFFDGRQFRRVHALETDLLRGTSGIVMDKLGNLWLNAGAGALRVSAEEVARLLADPRHLIKIDVFDENDGLTGQPTQSKRTPSAVSDTSGTLWFATGGDVVSLDPTHLGRARSVPSVLIETVSIDGKPMLTAPSLAGHVLRTSAARLHDLEIGYIGISLGAPERVNYRYRLLNEDKGWQDVGSRRQAFYTRLSPGTYKFEVSANNGEDWSDLAVPLRIEATPAVYQTWWFRLLCLLSLAWVAWFSFRARMRYATEQVHSRFSERLAERERVARELHDTLLQGFQGLMMRFHLAAQSIPAEQNARAEMEGALDRADLLLIESRDRIRDLRYEALDADSLPNGLELLCRNCNELQPGWCRFSVTGSPRELGPVSYQEIYAIAKEAVENAQRHSEASSLVIELDFDPARLRLRIADSGKGIDPRFLNGNHPTDHWGLAGMRERARNLKADLKLITSGAGGTDVTLTVPGGIAYLQQRKPSFFYNIFQLCVLALRGLRPERWL